MCYTAKPPHARHRSANEPASERTNEQSAPAVPGDVDVDYVAVLVEEREEVVSRRTCEGNTHGEGETRAGDWELARAREKGRARRGIRKGGTHGR
jgi:hypothetical protein